VTDEVLATIRPTLLRRGFAVGLLAFLGVVLVYLGFAGEGAGPVLRIVFVLMGAGSLVLSQHVWKVTDVLLILTETKLADSEGRVLCTTEEIVAMQRSAFEFKPSNGFAVKLTHKAERAWVPGIWWRYGRRLGVGGVVSKQEAKLMADIMALRLKMPEIEKMMDE